LCGKNGSGKSSIVKLILGESIPYQGVIRIGSRLKISYISQSTYGLAGDLTDYARGYGIDHTLFKTILRKLDFSRDMFAMNIKDFSDGQKKKVMIARSLCESAHLYIWDEPLNYIDVISRMQIEDLIRYYEPTLLFIEHDRAFCDNIATKMMEL
jgi:lincosamide and streptogramin A transport system ATP-binding/permease protein